MFQFKAVFSSVLSILFLSVIGASNAHSYQGQNVIRIGALLDLSGPYYPIGTASYKAIQARISNINSRGGLNGRRIEAIVYDTRSDQSRLLTGAINLKAQGVCAILGPTVPQNIITLRRFSETNKIPLILTTGANPVMTFRGLKTKWTFSTTLNFGAEIKALLSAFHKRGYENMSVLVQSSPFFKELSLWIRGYSPEYGLKIGCMEAFYLNNEDFSYKLKFISRCMPDILLIWAREQALDILKRHGNELQTPLGLCHWLFKKDLVASGNQLNGLIFVAVPRLMALNAYPSIQLDECDREFLLNFGRDLFFDMPSFVQFTTLSTWDAVGILLKALSLSPGASPKGVRESLETNIVDYKGTVGTFTFDKRNHSGLSPSSLIVLQRFGQRWSLFIKRP